MNDEAVGSNGEARRGAESNKLSGHDRPVHDWYRFVLSYPPHLVREYLERFGLNATSCVLDPFAGTATTLVEAKKRQVPSVGVEAHPLAHFAGHVKTDWTPDADQMIHSAQRIADAVRHELNADGIADESDCHDSVEQARLLRLPGESAKLLLAGSISPLPLHKTLLLLGAMREHSATAYHRHHLLALAKSLVTGIGNLHFGPEVGVGPAKPDAPVVEPWLHCVSEMANDLRAWGAGYRTPSAVFHGDARTLGKTLGPQTVDAVITSPPYPNEKDYTRTTRLEAVLLGFIRTRQDLRAVKQNLMRSNTRNVYRKDDDDQYLGRGHAVHGVADRIEARRIEMGKTSGFERMYHRVTRLYFGGMAKHFEELKRLLKPGARLAYVVGDQASYLRVMIRTGQLLAEIAESRGYEVESIDLFRTRYATATKEQLREEVVVLRWPG